MRRRERGERFTAEEQLQLARDPRPALQTKSTERAHQVVSFTGGLLAKVVREAARAESSARAL